MLFHDHVDDDRGDARDDEDAEEEVLQRVPNELPEALQFDYFLSVVAVKRLALRNRVGFDTLGEVGVEAALDPVVAALARKVVYFFRARFALHVEVDQLLELADGDSTI